MTGHVKRVVFADQIQGSGQRRVVMEYQGLPVFLDPILVGQGIALAR